MRPPSRVSTAERPHRRDEPEGTTEHRADDDIPTSHDPTSDDPTTDDLVKDDELTETRRR